MSDQNAGAEKYTSHKTAESTGRDDRDTSTAATDEENAGTEIGENPAGSETNGASANNTDDSQTVYIAHNSNGRTGIYHTDPDCSHLQLADNPGAVSRETLFDSATLCTVCDDSEPAPHRATQGRHYEIACNHELEDEFRADGGHTGGAR